MNLISGLGCPLYSTDKYMNFIVENRIIFGVLLWISGIFVTFLGLRFTKQSVFIVTLELLSEIIGEISFTFTNFETSKMIQWVIFAGSIALSLIVCYFALIIPRFGRFIVGVSCGVVSGFLIYNAIISPFITTTTGSAPLYLVVLLSASFFGVASVHTFE